MLNVDKYCLLYIALYRWICCSDNILKIIKTCVKCTKNETFAQLHRFHSLYVSRGCIHVSKAAKLRKRYNQVPDINYKHNSSQVLDTGHYTGK